MRRVMLCKDRKKRSVHARKGSSICCKGAPLDTDGFVIVL